MSQDENQWIFRSQKNQRSCLTKTQFSELLWKNSTIHCKMQFLPTKQDQLQQTIKQSNITENIKCFMNISYYELCSEVIVIKEFCVKHHIQQYFNDNWLIDKVYHVYILQENDDSTDINIYYTTRIS